MSEFSNVNRPEKRPTSTQTARSPAATLVFPDGTRKTLGIMLPGEYEFGTAEKGTDGNPVGRTGRPLAGPQPNGGHSAPALAFEVPASAKFSLKVRVVTDYCCSYIK